MLLQCMRKVSVYGATHAREVSKSVSKASSAGSKFEQHSKDLKLMTFVLSSVKSTVVNTVKISYKRDH